MTILRKARDKPRVETGFESVFFSQARRYVEVVDAFESGETENQMNV